MPQMNIIQSVNSALDIILEKDSEVCIFGQDVGYF
ncbi:MAG TPA: alpha-ketoacid dehydrogenase subunit beta, partial [Marine Group III euryarchaeote]|nr:alpha-ketoacid dehydrogenase subunit beta [Marine Group III euryarchaeote]